MLVVNVLESSLKAGEEGGKVTGIGCRETFVTVRLLFGEIFVFISYITEIFSSVIVSVLIILLSFR